MILLSSWDERGAVRLKGSFPWETKRDVKIDRI